MTNYDVKDLLTKYKEGTASTEEVTFLLSVVQQWTENADLTIEEAELLKVRAEIAENLEIVTIPIKTTRLWPRVAVAAAVVATIVLGVYFFKNNNSVITTPTQYTADIAPGKNGATITTASGRVIELSEQKTGVKIGSQLTYSDGSKVAGEIENEITTLTAGTTKGQTYRFTLADGTEVWLNAASKITFPSRFKGDQRKIQLEGEAYFEVAKDKTHPFIVESGNQQVEVLGTHFNVNAYTDEKTARTTLLEGSVQVSENGITKLLQPGFEAINTSGNLQINKADIEWATAWKNNKFIFDSQNIEDIMRMIGRWYNVEVIYTDKIPTDTFWGSVSRFNNISKVLSALESTGNVHFKLEGRKVYVSR